jgi:hypothetical protein
MEIPSLPIMVMLALSAGVPVAEDRYAVAKFMTSTLYSFVLMMRLSAVTLSTPFPSLSMKETSFLVEGCEIFAVEEGSFAEGWVPGLQFLCHGWTIDLRVDPRPNLVLSGCVDFKQLSVYPAIPVGSLGSLGDPPVISYAQRDVWKISPR